MTFDFYILASDIKRISERFNLAYFVDEVAYAPNFKIAAGSESYVIKNYQTKEILKTKFGLLRQNSRVNNYFVRAEGNRNLDDNPLYTGSKAIFLDPEYNKLIRFQRCLVLADAFVVGLELQKPHLIYLRGKNRPFALAGIYSVGKDQQNSDIEYFAIITTVANQLLQKLGQKRMPVILPPEFEHTWLRTSSPLSEILFMLSPFPAKMMNAYPIACSDAVSDINNRTVIEPIGKPVYEEKINMKVMSRLGKKESTAEKIHITLAERAKK